MWSSLRFEASPPRARAEPARADVVCFVGFAAARTLPLPAGVRQQLVEFGWGPFIGNVVPVGLPILIESYDAFAALYEPLEWDGDLSWEGYLSGAIRDFFRQGGRRAWVVALPLPTSLETAPDAAIDALLPHFLVSTALPSPSQRATWKGIWHLSGLPDVSMLCLPDLPRLLGRPVDPPVSDVIPPLPVPQFLECSPDDPFTDPLRIKRSASAPRAGEDQRLRWAKAVNFVANWLAIYRPDVQLLAALPLSVKGSASEAMPLDPLADADLLKRRQDGGIASAWVQAVWPWYKGDTTAMRPERIAPADGLLAGMIARSALENGCFRSLTGRKPEGVADLEPFPSARALYGNAGDEEEAELPARLCVLGPGRAGVRLLSDSTLSLTSSWQPGGTGRVMGSIRRSLLRIGERYTFDHNGPDSWSAVTRAVSSILQDYTDVGALGGPEPYRVRCDRSTMTQQDIDAGIMKVEVELSFVAPIRVITVVLSVVDGGVTTNGEDG